MLIEQLHYFKNSFLLFRQNDFLNFDTLCQHRVHDFFNATSLFEKVSLLWKKWCHAPSPFFDFFECLSNSKIWRKYLDWGPDSRPIQKRKRFHFSPKKGETLGSEGFGDILENLRPCLLEGLLPEKNILSLFLDRSVETFFLLFSTFGTIFTATEEKSKYYNFSPTLDDSLKHFC